MYKNLFSNKIDAFLVESPVNRFYFTGFSSSYGYVVLTENLKIFYTDPRYAEEAKAKLTEFSVKSVGSGEVFGEIVKDLTKAGVTTLGYEDDYLTVAGFKSFKKEFENFTQKPASEILKSLRLVKSPEEIARITAAQRVAEKVFEKVAYSIRPGDTEKEIRVRLICEALKAGADDMSFDPIVAFGENTAMPHHVPADREFQKGDLVLIDFGVKLAGYCSDMTRTFCLSEPDAGKDKFSQIYDIVLSAQSYALKHIKAGMTCREADSLAREYIRANGYDAEFSHSLGHGIGLEVHESPRIRDTSPEMLLPGMVITVEPGIYIPGLGGIRIEDMVVVREDGVENLTETAKDFVL